MRAFTELRNSREATYSRDQEMWFRIQVRRTRLLAGWAAARRGLTPAQTEAYAAGLVALQLEPAGYLRVIDRVQYDLSGHGDDLPRAAIEWEAERLLGIAGSEIRAAEAAASA
ncbi:hypothetical protein SAE02_76800 [Skermanella aerolata]|uniref:Aldolase n=1 Tax=Skermanella aerolata TaxID=393310 RepID=A0A512E4B1_9PROT|nr:ATPase inhibitor subunit zeta [Skermanella aerolata]KJB91381.1 hypothetical protein N826_30520 [Skermanella aerolata KACC 11604]GEO43532.1 hypothetical protein SAE02_76800 [Skermanella aerolata]